MSHRIALSLIAIKKAARVEVPEDRGYIILYSRHIRKKRTHLRDNHGERVFAITIFPNERTCGVNCY